MPYNPISLSGKRIIVTGASSGLGRETAIVLSKLGASIILVARNIDRLNESFQKLEGKGHAIYSFDLEQIDEIPKLIQRIVSEQGKLSGIFHAAGIMSTISINSIKENKIKPVFQTSIFASLMLAKAFSQKGICDDNIVSLVIMSSAAGISGTKGLAIYSASKAAIDGAVRAMAVEFAEKRIRVNSVAAGMIKTEMFDKLIANMSEELVNELEKKHPLGFGSPYDVAMVVAFLLSDASKWITGTTVVVDGGFTISK